MARLLGFSDLQLAVLIVWLLQSLILCKMSLEGTTAPLRCGPGVNING